MARFYFLFVLELTNIFVATRGYANVCDLAFYFALDNGAAELDHKYMIHRLLRHAIAKRHLEMHEINSVAAESFTNVHHGPEIALKYATFNTGLLHRLGGRASVPEYHERAKLIPSQLDFYLRSEKPAFLLLQEVWDLRDGNEIARIAALNGYSNFFAQTSGSRNPYGLQTLVRGDLLVDENSVEDLGVLQAQPQFVELLSGLQKGIFPLGITLVDGTRILLINTHFPYSPNRTSSRLRLMQSLTQMLKDASLEIDYILLGGDLNSSDRFARGFNPVETNWYKDQTVYFGLLQNTTEIFLRDAYAALYPAAGDGFTQDPIANELARSGVTTKSEPAQRIDYLFLGSGSHPEDHFLIDKSRLIFTEPVSTGSGKSLQLSDHFGVEAEVVLLGKHRG